MACPDERVRCFVAIELPGEARQCIGGLVAGLREAGVRFLIEPQEIDTAVGRRKIAFFEAPDGTRTEVMEILEDREEEAVRSA